VNKNEIAPRIIKMWEKKTSRISKDAGERKRQSADEPLFTEARPVKVFKINFSAEVSTLSVQIYMEML
jgi:hypothetical protein